MKWDTLNDWHWPQFFIAKFFDKLTNKERYEKSLTDLVINYIQKVLFIKLPPTMEDEKKDISWLHRR